MVRPFRLHSSASTPPETGWTWESWNAGRTIFPARSTTFVEDAIQGEAEAFAPTKTMRPFETATASAQLRAPSTV